MRIACDYTNLVLKNKGSATAIQNYSDKMKNRSSNLEKADSIEFKQTKIIIFVVPEGYDYENPYDPEVLGIGNYF
jgi:hypothetical protein